MCVCSAVSFCWLAKTVPKWRVIHIGYDVPNTYYILQDIFQDRAIKENLNYEGFRDLALRVQDYARLNPLDADIGSELVCRLALVTVIHKIRESSK